MFDVYGPRVIMALGTAIYVTSMLLMSAAGSYRDYLLAQGVLSGLGVGMLYVTPAFDVVCVPRSPDDLMQVLSTAGGHLDAFQQVPGDSAGKTYVYTMESSRVRD